MKTNLKGLALLSITLFTTTGAIGNLMVSCRNSKSKDSKTETNDTDGFEYGSNLETTRFSKNDFDKYLDDSLISIISLLSNKFLDQNANQQNFDFITVFNEMKKNIDPGNALIINSFSAVDKDYCAEAFLNDWTFYSELSPKEISLIEKTFVVKESTSEKQKIQDQLDYVKKIKGYKKMLNDYVKNAEKFIIFASCDSIKKNIDVDAYMVNFIKYISDQKESKLLKKVMPRFEKVFIDFTKGTKFDQVKDLTNVDGHNLISYIKKQENIAKMNDNFNSKTDDEKALMLFMIKLNYMYKYISSNNEDPNNGQFLFEALFEDITNAIHCVAFSESQAKLVKNGKKIIENISNYFKDIFENDNSQKSLEPFYCFVEGIMYIIKQHFYKVEIDQPILDTAVKLEDIFEMICEFVSVIKNDNNDLKYLNNKNGKDLIENLLLQSSLLEGIFIENESSATTVIGAGVGSAAVMAGLNSYGLLGATLASTSSLITGGAAGLAFATAAYFYNKYNSSATIPFVKNDNLKNFINTSWYMSITKLLTDKVNISKLIDNINIVDKMQAFLSDYQSTQEFQTYIQKFDDIKKILNDKDNNFIKELQEFVNTGGFKKIITELLTLIKSVEAVDTNLKDPDKKQEYNKNIDNLFKAIGIDRHAQQKDMLVNGSILDNLIKWINDPNNSIDKTFDNIFDSVEQDCNKWNDINFQSHINYLTQIVKNKKDIAIKYDSFEEEKSSDKNCSDPVIKLSYKLKLTKTNEIYNIEFKNKHFKKDPKSFKISRFEKVE